MALKLCNKIRSLNLNHVQQCLRLLSVKADVAAGNCLEKGVNLKEYETAEQDATEELLRYSVGQQRSQSMNKKYNTEEFSSEIETARKNIETQNLQPSMLPGYFQNPIDLASMAYKNEEGPQIVGRDSSERTRKFEQSQTYNLVTLPLRASKLASPFPDPVKVMISHQVSDEEKATQMYADRVRESRATLAGGRDGGVRHALGMGRSDNGGTLSTEGKREYSSKSTVSGDPDKCKKMGKKKGRTCTKRTLPGCPKPARKNCRRPPLIQHCKKQEAPYPSYSESCHEDLEERPSECKICPWKPNEHPYFKPQKKKFHTGVSREQEDRQGSSRITEEEQQDDEWPGLMERNQGSNCLERTGREETDPEAIWCDLKKTPCPPPPPGPCSKAKKKQEEQKKKKGKKSPKKKTSGERTEGRRTWLDLARAWAFGGGRELLLNTNKTKIPPAAILLDQHTLEDNWLEPDVYNEERDQLQCKGKKKDSGPGKGKCKKFPYPKCKVKREKDGERREGPCPPKKKKRIVKDCPPEGECNKKTSGVWRNRAQMLAGELQPDFSEITEPVAVPVMRADKYDKGRGKKDKRKCPVVDHATKEQEPLKCPKKKIKDRICPGDLLKKKPRGKYRRKRKNDDRKTSPGIPPLPRSPQPDARVQ